MSVLVSLILLQEHTAVFWLCGARPPPMSAHVLGLSSDLELEDGAAPMHSTFSILGPPFFSDNSFLQYCGREPGGEHASSFTLHG